MIVVAPALFKVKVVNVPVPAVETVIVVLLFVETFGVLKSYITV